MKKIFTHIAVFCILIASAAPLVVSAATAPPRFSYAGWIPFWKKVPGIQDITQHLTSRLNEISPFSYEVKTDGTLSDKLNLKEDFWPGWLSAVHDLHIKIIPTVAWFNGDRIHQTLASAKKRAGHIKAIVAITMSPYIDGVDIDYENKHADTKKYFSLFIKELALKLHAKKKLLTCTVEPRTPLSSLFREPHERVERANDYAVLGNYCDEVRIMAYDQGDVDFMLNDAKGKNSFYMPVADPDWVKKVIQETMWTIGRKKIMLGIPTYGYEYAATTTGTTTSYMRIRSRTYVKTQGLAATVGAVAHRNSAGELSFAYTATSTASGTPATRIMSFTDAAAIADKISLAKNLGLRGVILFKLDGEGDPALWDALK